MINVPIKPYTARYSARLPGPVPGIVLKVFIGMGLFFGKYVCEHTQQSWDMRRGKAYKQTAEFSWVDLLEACFYSFSNLRGML